MTGKRLIRLAAILAALTLLAPGVGHAEPKGGGGAAAFQCNVTLTLGFPNNIAFPGVGAVNPGNCTGGANGGGTSLTSVKKTSPISPVVPAVWTASSTYNVVTKTGPINLTVYNIQYGEDCSVLKGLPVPPPLGIAVGHAAIQAVGTNLPPATDAGTLKSAYVHTEFLYLRVGITFVAALIDPHMHNGIFVKPHKVSKPGGLGVAAGFFEPKPPVPNCAAKAPPVSAGGAPFTVSIIGVVAFVNNP